MNKHSQRALALVSTLVFAAILVAVNMLTLSNNARHDLTRDKVFSVSPQLRKLLGGLGDVLNVTVYVSPNLPALLLGPSQYTEDIIRELSTTGGAEIRLNVVEITPEREKDEKFLEEITKAGIQPIPIQVIERQQRTTRNIYFHLRVEYQGRSQVIQVPREGEFELRFAQALVRVTTAEPPIVAFADNSKERHFLSLGTFLKENGLGDIARVETIDLSEGKPLALPAKTRLLLLMAPERLSDSQLYEVDQFVMNGGRLVVFAEGAPYNDQLVFFRRPEALPNLNDWLRGRGFDIQSSLIQDWGSSIRTVMQTRGQNNVMYLQPTDYPVIPIVLRDNFVTKQAALLQVQRLLMPFAAPVRPAEGLDASKFRSEIMMTTTERADLQTTAPFNLDQPKPGTKAPDKLSRFPVAAMIEGPFTSAWKGRPAPPTPTSNEDPIVNFRLQQARYGPQKNEADATARILVFGSMHMVWPSVLQSIPDQVLAQENIVFIQNLIESETIGDALADIRAKQVRVAFLKGDIKDAERTAARFKTTFAVPIALIVLGIALLLLRRARLASLARNYAT